MDKRVFEGIADKYGHREISIREPTYGMPIVRFLLASQEEIDKWAGRKIRITIEEMPPECEGDNCVIGK